MRTIEDQLYKARMLSTAVQMGTCEPIDFFADHRVWLNILDGVMCCIQICHDDIFSADR